MRKNKLMSKIGAIALSAVMVAGSFVVMPAGEVKADEATTAAVEPVYFNDFEGGAGDTTVVGSGKFVDAEDYHFGKVFHNAAEGQALRTNYLLLPEDALAGSGESKEMTISFWVNVGTAVDYYWTPMFTAYGAAPGETGNGFPVFALQSRLVGCVNNAGWSDLVDAQNAAGTNKIGTQWLDDKAWHYYTATFAGDTVKIYVDGVLQNEWDAAKDYNNGTADVTDTTVQGLYTNGADLKYICLGGNQAFEWADNDPAYMFDDVAIYDKALTEAQMKAIMAEKLAVPMTGITVNETASVLAGGSVTLTYTIAPEDTTETPEITFTSDKTDVATVDNTGKVTGVAAGNATITVTAKVGEATFTDTCAVTVTADANPITGITATIDKNTIDLADDAKTANVKVEYTIKDATKEPTDSKTVTYTSSDEKVATVDKNGVVTAVGKGTAIITAALENGQKATVTLTVSRTIKLETEVDCPGWWKAHTTGVEVTKEGVKLTFKNTTYDSAAEQYHGPIYVLYTGSEPKINGTGYVEYAVMRGDLYGWTPTADTGDKLANFEAAGNKITASGVDFSDATAKAEYIKALKSGANCTVVAKLVDGGVQVKMTVGKAVSTTTWKVDTTKPVYISLGGELCKLTDIKVSAMETSSNNASSVPTAITKAEVDKMKFEVTGAPADTKLVLDVIADTEITKVESFKASTLKGLTFQAIDIKLMKGTEAIQPGATVTVKVTVPESLKDANEVKVFRLDTDKLTEVKVVEFKDGMVSFETDHFSTYVFAAATSETADTAPVVAVVVVAFVAAAAVLVSKKRRVTE